MIDRENYKKMYKTPICSMVPTENDIAIAAAGKKKRNKALIISIFVIFFGGIVISNGVVFAATGRVWIKDLFTYEHGMANGGLIIEYNNENQSADEGKLNIYEKTENAEAYYSIYENGRTYFIFDDVKLDISNQISDGNYYKYEYTDDEDVRHVILVGEGEMKYDGESQEFYSRWIEIFYFPNGEWAHMSQLGSSGITGWVKKAYDDYNIDTYYPPFPQL